MNLLLGIAIINLLIFAFMGFQLILGIKRIPILKELEITPKDKPLVSIIIAACNEEESIKKSIDSIEGLNYDNKEVIVVNDRSTDNTGNILKELQTKYPNLKVIQIKELPKGWLGKNHALYQGAHLAQGRWLLFTDADIIFAPETLDKAIGYSEKNGLDHLALLFEIMGGTLPYRIYFTYWVMSMTWLITQIKTTGVGAFNLVKRDVYFAIGTHKVLALRPDDDIKLAKLLVDKGFKSSFLFGKGLIKVKWYGNLIDLAKGFEKNAFSVMEYNIFAMLATTIFSSFSHIFPLVGIIFGDSITKIVCIIIILMIFLMYRFIRKYFDNPWWYAFFNPISAVVNSYILLRASFINLIAGEIVWRGTSYPLELLKKNKV